MLKNSKAEESIYIHVNTDLYCYKYLLSMIQKHNLNGVKFKFR